MNTTNLPTPPRSKPAPEHGPQNPNIPGLDTPAPNQSVSMQLPPAQPVNPASPERKTAGGHPPPAPRRRIPYLPGPTLEDEKRAIVAQNNLPISTKKNALRPCGPAIRAPTMSMGVDRATMCEQHPVPESPYKFTRPTIPRRSLVEAWRARMGLDLSARTAVPPVSKGGLLSTTILDQIVVFMLLDAHHKTRPRTTLKNFALACRRFRYVAGPYIYQHVILRGNGDAGVYARTGTCKFVRSLTIQFEPHDPWNPYSVLLDPMLYPTPLQKPEQIQETGIEYFFPNITQIAFVAKFAPDEARARWLASAQIFGPEFGTGQFGPPNRSRLYENPAFLALKLVQLVPPEVKMVTLEADIPGLVSNFAVLFMIRTGDPEEEARLDIVTHRDEVVQETEFAVHSHVPAPTDPRPPRTTIIMYGPTYGTSIIWDGTNPAFPHQTVWRRRKESNKCTLPEEVLPPTWEELGPGPRRSTRKSTSPYKNPVLPEDGNSPIRKRGVLTAMVKSAGRTPKLAKDRARRPEPSPEPEVEPIPETPEEPESTPEPIELSLGQRCAWSAGCALAEYPDAIASTFEQVNDSFAQFASNTPSAQRMQLQGEDAEYPEFWQFVDNLAGNRSRIGVWHTTARTEVDMFVTTYRTKRFGASMRSYKLQMKNELREDEIAVEQEAGKTNMERTREMMTARKAANANTASSSASSGAGDSGAASSGSGSGGRVTKRVRIA
ncbi:hypothetical protein FRC11_005175 [Ceratobasidium sp. 423]|nr:hypothetical protein FRC11_005175 [Ceratobasidium sp. 423]